MTSARNTASAQLERILYLIPRAARENGCRIADLAADLDVPASQILRDIEELAARTYYLPAGAGDDLQIRYDDEWVHIWTTRELQRPAKLTPLEALALALGFRVLAAEDDADRRNELLTHAHRLEREFATGPIDELLGRFAIDAGDRGETGVQATLRAAARERRHCRIDYLKPGATTPETRTIAPYTLLRTGAAWYALGLCTTRQGLRLFRADRTIAATLLPETFEVPDDFDPEAWFTRDGEVFRAETEIEVVVRYSPRIARWLRERGPVEELDDGGVLIRHRVADHRWVVRHILQYAGEAEVLEPVEIRELIREAAARIGERSTGEGGGDTE